MTAREGLLAGFLVFSFFLFCMLPSSQLPGICVSREFYLETIKFMPLHYKIFTGLPAPEECGRLLAVRNGVHRPPNGRHNSHPFPMCGGTVSLRPPKAPSTPSQFVCNGRTDPVVARACTSGVTSPVLVLEEEAVLSRACDNSYLLPTVAWLSLPWLLPCLCL